MSPAARREAFRLLWLMLRTPGGRVMAVVVAVFVALFAGAATVSFRVTTRVLRRREARREVRRAAAMLALLLPHRHRRGRHRREHGEVLLALASRLVRPFRDARDRAPASAVTFAGLFLLFASLIGAAQ